MLETGFAQMRFAASILFGTRFSLRSLDRLIASLQATQHEFGFLRSDGRDLLVSPQLDEETHQAIQLRRFRSQAARAARETVYYHHLFERLGLDAIVVGADSVTRRPARVLGLEEARAWSWGATAGAGRRARAPRPTPRSSPT